MFSSDPRVIVAAADYLVILAASQIFMGVEITVTGGFSGAGDTLPPMLVSIPLTLLRIPVAYVLTFVLGAGGDGVWWAISGTTILKGGILYLWFRTGRWKRARV